EETMLALELYRSVVEDVMAIPVVCGEKPENERFPGADRTYSIEAMMQDGKALQAGTSHYLGTHFAEAQNIRYQDKDGGQTLAHTTSWGTSTRLIGGMIMTHGDDDGMRTPPAMAPRQIVVVPMLRNKPEDDELKQYCKELVAELNKGWALGAPIRAYVDVKDAKPSDKRWDWVRRGAPLICEIGPRDAAGGNVTFIKRNALREGEKIKSNTLARADFLAQAAGLLESMQKELFDEAKARLEGNIRGDFGTFADIEMYYGTEDKESEFKGWARVQWSRPTGAALEEVGKRLKALKLTIRNAPLAQPSSFGACIFSGAPAVEEILIARAY
ncbi:MAG: His/Gly/Thr/Pro-type tRNA ligase C-terminal domain-containing protein, partial [Terricaulis sp.]